MLDEETDTAVEDSPVHPGEDGAVVDARGHDHYDDFGVFAPFDFHNADPKEHAGDEEPSGVIPIEEAHFVQPIPIEDAHFVEPAKTRNPAKKTTDVSLIISVTLAVVIHGLLIAVAILLLGHRSTLPKFHAQRGDGMATGQAGEISQSDAAAGPGQVRMPLSSVQDISPASLGMDSPRSAEEAALDAVPPEFAAPPKLDDDQPRTDPILFGFNPASMQNAMPARRSPSPAAAKSAAAAGHEAGVSSSAAPSSDGAVAPAGSPAGGSAGKTHVWTGIRPAGKGGAGGHGGSRDGLNSNGWPIPDYPSESRRRGEEGRVKVEMEMRSDGTVGNIKVVQDAGFPRLAAAAVDAARHVKFDPATCDGKPVTITVLVPFDFSLK